MTLYVGNFCYSTTRDELFELFEQFGHITGLRLVNHPETQKPRGFAFLDMSDEDGAKAAAALDGADFRGRKLTVNAAERRPKKPRRD